MMPSTAASSASGSKTNYNYLRKTLRLIVDEVNEQEPNDVAYVYSGYAPLSVRLVQCVLQKPYLLSLTKGASSGGSNGVSGAAQGWRGFDEALKYAKGKTFDEVQRGEDKAVRARMILNGQNERKTVFVFFLGGITYTEVAALRFIAKKEGGEWVGRAAGRTLTGVKDDGRLSSVRHPSSTATAWWERPWSSGALDPRSCVTWIIPSPRSFRNLA